MFCSIYVDADFCRLSAPYNEKFVEELKDLIPPDKRRFVPETSSWEFSVEYLDEVEELAGVYFVGVSLL